MSSHGRRRQNPEPAGPAQLAWALLVVAAALIGGLAAVPLVHTSVTIAVIVSLVAGGIAVLVVFRSPARRPELTNRDPKDAELGPYATAPRRRVQPADYDPHAVPPASFASGAPAPVASGSGRRGPVGPGPEIPDGQAGGPQETVVQLLPLQPGGATGAGPPDAPWWDSAQGPPAPSSGAKRAPAPDLSTYMASTFIAQCPRCGAFRLDIRRARNGWDFRCESCDYTWTWQPGTPWPPVRVMPGGRRESRPPAP